MGNSLEARIPQSIEPTTVRHPERTREGSASPATSPRCFGVPQYDSLMKRRRRKRDGWGDIGKGLAFLSPWIVGFTLFPVTPIILSAYFSVCDYSLLDPPMPIGLD